MKLFSAALCAMVLSANALAADIFPDGTPVDAWFADYTVPELSSLGKQYVLTAHGILSDGNIHTKEIQALIDDAAQAGGGVVVVPAGVYKTGALFFRQGVNLYVAEGGVLMGSDDPADYPVMDTRIEGESCKYYPALINVDGIDGFTMCGPGTIDGNGLRSWKAFWQRRSWNPKCTNKDEQRARLVFVSNSKNVTVAQLNLQNSQFWTNHIYKCERVKFIGCRIFSPASPVKAPSTDAIDIDVCTDVLVKNCYMEVNDDAVVLKGGKGPWADTAPENGANERIIIEDCTYGFCHGCLTCGSESVHNRNIILRRINVTTGQNLLWLKMRPDTPQLYEYITVESITGSIKNFITVKPWTQFYDLKGRKDVPMSAADHIVMRNCNCTCTTYFNVTPQADQYTLTNFTFENLNINATNDACDASSVKNFVQKKVNVKKL
ncbi:MAG: exopolygalacturonase [Bacteroidales bacterium]|nr:exopolygalacturonase [Bacteroidales bacterium]